MNGPVAPAASPAGPTRPDRLPGARGRLPGVLLAPVRALAFFGLTLAGAVLLVGVVGPAAIAVLGLGHLALDLQRQGAWRGGDGLYLLVGLIGLTFCRFLAPATLLGVRRLAMETRLLSARWCAVAIPAAYRPSPADRQPDGRPGAARLRYQQRMDWLLSDPGTWKDLLWLAVNAVVGTVMLLVPIGLVLYGALVALNVSLHPVGQAALSVPERVGGALLLAAGAAAGPRMLRAYGGLARLVLAPSESSVLEQRVAYLAQTRQESLDTGAA